jgi:hypothetical protein
VTPHAYDFIPAPLWLLTVLHVLTLTLHFIAMNLLAGGAAILAYLQMTGRGGSPAARRYTRALPAIMAATITLGVAPLLFVQLIYPRQVYGASITSGWLWLAIIPALIVAYYLVYAASFGKADNAHARWYLLGALAVFLYVSFVYSSVFSMGERMELIKTLYAKSQSGLIVNPALGEYLARWGHMLLGALTVAGFFLGALAGKDAAAFRTAKRLFLWGMVGASVLGIVYMLTLGDILGPFMRGPGIYAVTLGVVLSLAALHYFFTRRLWIAGILVFVSMLTMVFARHEVRLLRLAGQYDPATVPVHPQWVVFGLFLFFFVVGLGVVAWMARVFFSGPKAKAA